MPSLGIAEGRREPVPEVLPTPSRRPVPVPDVQQVTGEFRAPRSMRQTISAGAQLLLGLFMVGSGLADGDHTEVVIGVLAGVAGAGTLLPIPWPDRTVIDGDGIRLPRIWGVPRRVPWAQVEAVQPAWYPAGKSTLVLTDGSRRVLRFVPAEVAEDLASRLRSGGADAHACPGVGG